jgi:hypothetical protein
MDRKDFLFKSGALGLALAMGASSCSPGSGLYRQNRAAEARHLPRIKIFRDRVIKETVGLRTYRLRTGLNSGGI